MDIFVYSDESGVFDANHFDTFTFSGLVFTDIQRLGEMSRRFRSIETNHKKKAKYKNLSELKASKLDREDRNNIYKSIVSSNDVISVVISQTKLDKEKVFSSNKAKKRYLNFAYRCLIQITISQLIQTNKIYTNDKANLHIIMDSRQVTEQDNKDLILDITNCIKDGYYEASGFVKPLLPNLDTVTVQYKNSETTPLIRAADIVANKVFSVYRKDKLDPEYSNNIEQDFIAFLQLP